MHRSLCAIFLPVLAASFHAPPLLAQHPEFGVLLGHSFVGGGDSRTLVDVSGQSITGADRAGTHARAFLDFPIRATPLSIRTDFFYNRLSSGPNTVAHPADPG